MCKCKSYNTEVGTVPETILEAPEWSERETICVDACIAETIKYLWANKVVTLGSCCGHNGQIKNVPNQPSVILSEGETDYKHIRDIIAEKDSRQWMLKQWQLAIV